MTDQPKVYDLQARYAEQAGTPFTFRWADREWTLPHLRDVDFAVQAEIESWDPQKFGLDTINDLFAKLFGDDQAAEWAKVTRPLPFLFMLFDDWLKHCGAEPGESPASDGSSTSTKRPSKRTSSGSTASASRRRSTPRKQTAATPPVNS